MGCHAFNLTLKNIVVDRGLQKSELMMLKQLRLNLDKITLPTDRK